MSVEHISQGAGTHPLHQSYLDAKKKIDSQHKPGGEVKKAPSDKIQISDDARQLIERDSLVKELQKTLETLPDVRPEKVQQSTERLESGYYEQQQVYENISGQLLNENEETNNEINDIENQPIQDNEIDIRLDKIQEVQKRIEENYYERREIMENIIDRLLG